MIAVTALLGMVVLFAALRLDWAVPKYELRSVATRIGALSLRARGYAITRGRAFYVEYDLSNRRVALWGPVISEDEPPEEKGQEGFVPVPAIAPADKWEEVSQEALPEGIDFEDVWIGAKRAENALVRIEFTPLGTADTHTVHLKGEGDLRFTVHVSGVTGVPELHEERWDPPAPRRADED